MNRIRAGARLGAASQDDAAQHDEHEVRAVLGLIDPDGPERLSISKIRRDGGTQPRAELNQETIAEYAEDMKRGDKFPPGIVFYDGKDYWLVRGFTRTAAAESLGWEEFDYIVKQGARRDAVLFSVGENADHGLRRTNADKRRAVMTLLGDSEWQKWNNSEIARQCHVDEKTVRNLRAESENSPLSSENPKIGGNKEKKRTKTRTVQRGGSTYEMETGRIGKVPASKPSAPPPEPARNLDESDMRGWGDDDPRPTPRSTPPAESDVPTEEDNRQWIISQYRKLTGMVEERGQLGAAHMSRSIVSSLVQTWGQKK